MRAAGGSECAGVGSSDICSIVAEAGAEGAFVLVLYIFCMLLLSSDCIDVLQDHLAGMVQGTVLQSSQDW